MKVEGGLAAAPSSEAAVFEPSPAVAPPKARVRVAPDSEAFRQKG